MLSSLRTMQAVDPSLLILIPAYNEEGRIGPVLRSYAAYFDQHQRARFSIVVVLNGCVDNTLAVVDEAAKEWPQISAMNFPGRIGKGGALIEGLKLFPLADLIGFVDADGATPPAAFHDLVKHCAHADCAIGSRWIAGAKVHQAQSGVRRLVSRGGNAIVQCLFWMRIHDTQCGAKVLCRSAVERIHPSLRITDMAFYINLLYSLKREGFRVVEVPTEWTDKLGSTLTRGLVRASFSALLSVIRLRLVHSPFYRLLRPFRPVEIWLYKQLSSPAPLSSTADPSAPQNRP